MGRNTKKVNIPEGPAYSWNTRKYRSKLNYMVPGSTYCFNTSFKNSKHILSKFVSGSKVIEKNIQNIHVSLLTVCFFLDLRSTISVSCLSGKCFSTIPSLSSRPSPLYCNLAPIERTWQKSLQTININTTSKRGINCDVRCNNKYWDWMGKSIISKKLSMKLYHLRFEIHIKLT